MARAPLLRRAVLVLTAMELLPASSLFLSRLVTPPAVSIDLRESLVMPCARRQKQRQSLRRFVREELTPRQLSSWLTRPSLQRKGGRGLSIEYVSAETAETAPGGGVGATPNPNEGELLLLSLKERIYLGPARLGLYIKPKVVCWLSKQGRGVEAEAHMCGDVCESTAEVGRPAPRPHPHPHPPTHPLLPKPAP